MKRAKNRASTARGRLSAVNRFCRDQSGQGILFAAVCILLLAGFVALVFNVGRLTQRRTQIQMAADAAVYSGSMVEANSLSTIAWINSAMAQIYYNAMKYAVDVNVTAVAAKLELIQSIGPSNGTPDPAVPALAVHRQAMQRAEDPQTGMQRAKVWMQDLSRLEHSVAILTPRLVQEEMFAVANGAGSERLSFFPSFRMFPHPGSSVSYRIEQFQNGWRVTNIAGGNGEMIYVYLVGNEWHLQYSQNGVVVQEVVIAQEAQDRWRCSYYEPPGHLIQEIYLVRTGSLGWVVWGQTQGGSLPRIEFEQVDMDPNIPGNEGTRITYAGISQTFWRGPAGDLYVWNTQSKQYKLMTSSETTIAGVRVRLNVTNVIHFPGATVRIGDPTTVDIGRAHIVLSDPPVISTSFGIISISIHGFDAASFNISVGGFSLAHGDADGRWRKHYNPIQELWWRHRLTEQDPTPPAIRQWQYDRQDIGAHLRQDNAARYVDMHVIGDRHPGGPPVWTTWFDPIVAQPRNFFRHLPGHYTAPDSNGIIHLDPQYQPPQDAYYITRECTWCHGTGYVVGTDPQGNPVKEKCLVCEAKDHDGDNKTDVRVCLGDVFLDDPRFALYLCDGKPGLEETDYADARIHRTGYNMAAVPYPLVLAEEFFQTGLNVGTWRSPESLMVFPQEYEPDWGYAAIASARVGIPDPAAGGGYKYNFSSRWERENWCLNSPHNLYAAGVKARLYPCRQQMNEYDLDRGILQGTSLTPTMESPTSYLWDAIIGSSFSHPYESNNWLDQYDGRSDASVGRALRRMRNRDGHRFDYGHSALDDVVLH